MNTVPSRPIKVMIVDDSTVIRSIIDKIIKSEPDIEVCGYATNGEQAVRTISICNPDVIILDIEMPVMDGITAIPLLLEKKPGVRILMCSTLSEQGADISIRALSLGATDCILKPGASSIQQSDNFHDKLRRMVRQIGESTIKNVANQPVPIRKIGTKKSAVPHILAIGSSTGGPNALAAVLPKLKNLSVPIVITQHMPQTFTKILANHLSQVSGIECREGSTGMVLQAGRVYIAPGGYHMTFRKSISSEIEIILNDGPMENFCKPSVNPMLRSLCDVYGSHILLIMLTGMGEDGLTGAKQLVAKGGQVIAQDAATSVVWGMPGAVATAGICNAVLPLSAIPEHILQICGNPHSSLNRGGAI